MARLDNKDNNDTHSSEKRRGHAQRTLEFQKVEKDPGQFRRPRPRRRPSEVTAEFGSVSPRRVKKKTSLSSIKKSAKQGVQTVKVRGAKLPWPMMLTAALCTLVVIVMVFNYISLNELTNEYGSLQREIVSLNADKRSLTLALDRKNDLVEIDRIAEEAGMVKNDRVEKRYVNLTGEDKIVVPEEDKGAISEFFDKLKNALSSIIGNIFK